MAGTRNLAWLGSLFLAAFIALALAPLPLATDLEARGAAAIAPLAEGMRGALRPVADVVLNAGQLEELSAQNAALRTELARLAAENASLREAGIADEQIAALRSAVGADQAERFLSAAVVLRDPAPSRSSFLIDGGRSQGIAVGQPVLGPGATLVGTVVEVSASGARVRLLDDPDSAVTAVLQQSRVPGALAGSPDGLRLEFVPAEVTVAEGDIVLTSALGGGLPAGLPIGRVTTVHADTRALFATVAVEPLTDYRRLERVLVMTDFVPDALLDAATGSTADAP